MTKTKPIPPADPFDTERWPFGKQAGDNKLGLTQCPTCRKPPTHPTAEEYPWPNSQIPAEGFYMFRNEISAREYYISGMCQDCQDSVFGED
jgi:hypothetical protein